MVAIKGYNMPACCDDCELWFHDHQDEPRCNLTFDYIHDFHKRCDSCPLCDVAESTIKDNMASAVREAAKLYSVEIPCTYCDGTQTTDKMISLEELGRILTAITLDDIDDN